MSEIKPPAHSLHKFVEIEWLDATSDCQWLSADKLPTPISVTSRGWLIKQELTYLVLAASITDRDPVEYGEVITIPMGMVEALTEIEV